VGGHVILNQQSNALALDGVPRWAQLESVQGKEIVIWFLFGELSFFIINNGQREERER
jgi:hypothetical protein